MCLICVQLEQGKLTTTEAQRNLDEMAGSLGDHAGEVAVKIVEAMPGFTLINKDAIDEKLYEALGITPEMREIMDEREEARQVSDANQAEKRKAQKQRLQASVDDIAREWLEKNGHGKIVRDKEKVIAEHKLPDNFGNIPVLIDTSVLGLDDDNGRKIDINVFETGPILPRIEVGSDQLFNLVQKSSLPVETLFELLGIDGKEVEKRLAEDKKFAPKKGE